MTAIPLLEMSYGTNMSESFRARRVNFGDGYSQRAKDGLNTAKQVWQLTWKNISDADAETLRVFFEGLGGVDIIDWQPYGQAVTLKWTANEFKSTPTGAMIATCSVVLSQEYDL